MKKELNLSNEIISTDEASEMEVIEATLLANVSGAAMTAKCLPCIQCSGGGGSTCS